MVVPDPEVVLAPDWLEPTTHSLVADSRAAVVTCKMVGMADPGTPACLPERAFVPELPRRGFAFAADRMPLP